MEFINQEKYSKDIGIYAITNVLTDTRYIGQTGVSFERRYIHHQWKLRNHQHDNQHLQAAFDKYGEDNFVFEVLRVADSASQLDSLEIDYIASCLNSYNILKGGGGRRGVPMSDHAKQIVGEKNRQHMQGKKLSEETKRKMSESHQRKTPDERRRSTIITKKIAKRIKKRLVKGDSITKIANDMSLPRHVVANMVTNRTWKDVTVPGWDEFLAGRTVGKRLHKDEVQALLFQYRNGESIDTLASQYNRTKKEIASLIRRHAA